MEIERKFLINDDSYKQLAFSKAEICQAYICRGSGATVRVRMRRDIPLTDEGAPMQKGYLTIKGPSSDGISRYEWEHEIPVDEANELFELCEVGRVEKTRWLVRSGKHIVEVDEFHGDNQGLVFAEIELAHVDEPYTAPSFLGAEVTGDSHYSNGYLSHHPFKTWNNI